MLLLTGAVSACGGRANPDFTHLDTLESGGAVDFRGSRGAGVAERSPSIEESGLSAAAPSPPASDAERTFPWQFETPSAAEGLVAEQIPEGHKPPSNELPAWIRDPMSMITERERRMAALTVETYGKRGAALDAVLAARGFTRAQAVAAYRELADQQERGGPYTEQMYQYQSWVVQGEALPTF